MCDTTAKISTKNLVTETQNIFALHVEGFFSKTLHDVYEVKQAALYERMLLVNKFNMHLMLTWFD